MNEWHILFCFGSKPGRPGSMKRRSFVQGKQCTKEQYFSMDQLYSYLVTRGNLRYGCVIASVEDQNSNCFC